MRVDHGRLVCSLRLCWEFGKVTRTLLEGVQSAGTNRALMGKFNTCKYQVSVNVPCFAHCIHHQGHLEIADYLNPWCFFFIISSSVQGPMHLLAIHLHLYHQTSETATHLRRTPSQLHPTRTSLNTITILIPHYFLFYTF